MLRPRKRPIPNSPPFGLTLSKPYPVRPEVSKDRAEPCRSILIESITRLVDEFRCRSVAAAGDSLFFASPKKSKQKKGDPTVCVPPLRYGQPAVLGPAGVPLALASLKQSLALIRLDLRSSAHSQGFGGPEFGSRRQSNWPLSLKSAIQHGVSSNSYWQMSRTPVINQAVSNAWLKEQGLLSVKDLWCKAQGYTAKKGKAS